ncbi:MAG: tRNA uridine-5-carboxymethylaminomethyl(34) synthesis GTPase MnmE [Betaproteobacteria bacterium]
MSAVPDTIAAIATPPGRGGIGIVRVSGGNATLIMEALIGQRLTPRLATVATFRGDGREPLDQGLGLFFPAPHSYTGEDVLELHGHGGPAVLGLVLARCLAVGARLAAPGEFTQRAFLNGKLDLAQAESVADLIDAATNTAAKAAARSLSGEFSREVRALVDGLVDLRMLIEAALDFPEEDLAFVQAGNALARVDATRDRLAGLLVRAGQGALLREGLVAVLIGQPNVGKSSLMNRLSGEDVAIVTPIPGTTRDALRSTIDLGGIPVTLVDTAGLRPTDDPIETMGIERTWKAVGEASLVLHLIDARGDDREAFASDNAILARLPATLPRVIIHNKIDLAGRAPACVAAVTFEGAARRFDVWLSAKTGEGVELLRRVVLEMAGAQETMEDTFLARARHLEALRAAALHLDGARRHLASPVPPLELLAEELRGAQAALSAITGEFSADELLGVIFSRFCIGK